MTKKNKNRNALDTITNTPIVFFSTLVRFYVIIEAI